MTTSSMTALSRRRVRYEPARAALIVCLLLLGQACNDGSPTGSFTEPVELQVSVFVAGTPINTLVLEVSAADFTTLVFNLTVVDGVATGTIRIPPGLARTIDATAFDEQGVVTHEGQATIDVRPGMNPPVHIPMTPRSGHVPVTITFGQYAVVVTPAEATIDSTISTELQLSVAVTTSSGTLPNPAVTWATTNPALATVTAAGLVTGHLDGVVNVVAVYEGVAGLSLIQLSGFGGSPPPPPVCAWPWTPTNVNPCDPAIPTPTAALSLGPSGDYVYHTTTGMLTQAGQALPLLPSALITQLEGVTARVVSVSGFSLFGSASLRVFGEYPLILLVDGDAVVGNDIDVSALASLPGPGGSIAFACGASTGGVAEPALGASGGGGGGGHGFRGGSGGRGSVAGAIGGFVGGSAEIAPLKGGCGGGASGSIGGTSGATPGGGGGAIQISARVSLVVSGSVRGAGGGGGTGAAPGVGGGGGGAGGAILLESDAVTIRGIASLCANGGSGGEGRDASSLPAGVGSQGTCDPNTPATTPNLLFNGGNGGVGAAANFDPTESHGRPGGVGGGGGGGGGGWGRIRVRGVTTRVIETGAVLTPEPGS